MEDTQPKQQHTLDGAEPSKRRAKGEHPMGTSSVQHRENSTPTVEPTILPSRQLPPTQRPNERRVAPCSKQARLSDLENRMDQLLSLIAHSQETQWESSSKLEKNMLQQTLHDPMLTLGPMDNGEYRMRNRGLKSRISTNLVDPAQCRVRTIKRISKINSS